VFSVRIDQPWPGCRFPQSVVIEREAVILVADKKGPRDLQTDPQTKWAVPNMEYESPRPGRRGCVNGHHMAYQKQSILRKIKKNDW
jgi:hypothetical protein